MPSTIEATYDSVDSFSVIEILLGHVAESRPFSTFDNYFDRGRVVCVTARTLFRGEFEGVFRTLGLCWTIFGSAVTTYALP